MSTSQDQASTPKNAQDHFERDLTLSALCLAVAHLTLALGWWRDDSPLIDGLGRFAGIFPAVELSALGAMPPHLTLSLWVGGALMLLVRPLRSLGALSAGLGLIGCLGALPLELISHSERALIALTILFMAVNVCPRGARARFLIARWGSWVSFTVWAWLALGAILGGEGFEVRGWRWAQVLNYWGWSDATPTPLALICAQSPSWLREWVGVILFSTLAWGPVLWAFRIRHWWIVWCALAPCALWVGDGFPTWGGSALMLGGVACLDMRWRNGLDDVLTRRFTIWSRGRGTRYLHALTSPAWLLGVPTLVLGSWLTLTIDHLCVTLLIGALWFMSGPSCLATSSLKSGDSREQLKERPLRPMLIALLTLSVWVSCMGVNLIYFEWAGVKRNQAEASHRFAQRWLPSGAIAEWTQVKLVRTRLILELSQDSNSSWNEVTPLELRTVRRDDQPWRPLSSRRYERWYYSLAKYEECEEGPLMELLEGELKHQIRAQVESKSPEARTRQLKSRVIQDTLVRMRRELWTRAYQGFWRARGAGFFCIPTNLPVLLKARNLVRRERARLPQMPRLAPEPQRSAQTPPTQTPPAQTPPAQTPPAQTPPAPTPPAQTPPAQTPPAQTPPAQTPPAPTPPAQTPPAQTPPAQTPPAPTH